MYLINYLHTELNMGHKELAFIASRECPPVFFFFQIVDAWDGNGERENQILYC